MATFSGNASGSSVVVYNSSSETKCALGTVSVPLGFISIIIYLMRAYHTTLNQFVYWESVNTPDATGVASTYDVSDLSDIKILAISDRR